MTSSQIKKLQKKMKKSYKKASLIKEKMEKYHDEEVKEAEKLLKKIDLIN
jgi:predicted metal-binding protein